MKDYFQFSKYCLLLISLVTGLSSCSLKKENDSEQKSDSLQSKTNTVSKDIDYYSLQTYVVSPISDTSQVLKIDFDCALLIGPTSEQIEELRKENSEDDFATIADDGSYYQATSNMLLDSMKIKVVDATKDMVQYVGVNKTWTLQVRKKEFPIWNLILFNKKKEPIVVGTAGLTAEQILSYF